MLRSIGKYSKSFFIKVLVGIIILPFIFWGMGDVFRGGNQNIIASIDNEKINTQEFINYLNNLNLSKDQVKNIKNSDLVEKVLSSYIGRKVLELEIKNLGIHLTDDSLRKIIINDKNFFKDKKFSRTKYEKFLIESGITAPMFEKNISEQEKKMQLLSYLSEGLIIPDFLIQSEFNKENQIKTVKYIDLNNYYKNQKPEEKNVKEIYEKNKKFFIENYKSLSFVELSPKSLVGNDAQNDSYFKIIDSIENDILDGKDIKLVSKTINLNLKKTNLLNKQKKNIDGVKNEILNDELFNRIFLIKNKNKPELIKLKNKYYLAEVTEVLKKEKGLKNKEVLDSIYKQIDIKEKIENNTTIVKQISEGKFNKEQMVKYAKENKLDIKNLVVSNIKDNSIFTEGLIKRIFNTKDGQINLVTDSLLKNNFIVLTEKTEFINIKKNTQEFNQYKAKAKLGFANEIYKVYDNNLNEKYKVELNNKTIDRIKNSF